VYRNADNGLNAAAAEAAIKKADLVLVDHLEVFPYVPARTVKSLWCCTSTTRNT
jgi:hypothetical protein